MANISSPYIHKNNIIKRAYARYITPFPSMYGSNNRPHTKDKHLLNNINFAHINTNKTNDKHPTLTLYLLDHTPRTYLFLVIKSSAMAQPHPS